MVKRRCSNWLQSWHRDPWVQQAKSTHYRSRAVFKLREIDVRDGLFRRVRVAVDIGAAPGSWSQYAIERMGREACLLAIDRLAMPPIDNVHFVQGDFKEENVQLRCGRLLGARHADLVLSDIAPNMTGILDVDQAQSMELAGQVADFCRKVLRPGGDLLVKVFTGAGIEEYTAYLRGCFRRVLVRKPTASRRKSREYYLLSRGYRCNTGTWERK